MLLTGDWVDYRRSRISHFTVSVLLVNAALRMTDAGIF